MQTKAPPATFKLDRVAAQGLRDSLANVLVQLDGHLRADVTGIEGGIKPPVNAATRPPDPRAEHRRQHRAGVLAKLEARLATLTFDQVVSAVAAAFPPPRRISRTSLHRWWHRHGKHQTIPTTRS
jgi:hypothetical protein